MNKKSDPQTKGYIQTIMDLPRDTTVRVWYNTECLKCQTVEKEMISVGSLVMCGKCFEEEFNTHDPVKEEREKYLKWLKIYKREEMARV